MVAANAGDSLFRTRTNFTESHGSSAFHDAGGVWSDTLNNSNDDANALTEGTVTRDALTATSADGSSFQVVGTTLTHVYVATAIGGQVGDAMPERSPPLI